MESITYVRSRSQLSTFSQAYKPYAEGRGQHPAYAFNSNFEKCRSIFSCPSPLVKIIREKKSTCFFAHFNGGGRGLGKCMICTLVKMLIIVNDLLVSKQFAIFWHNSKVAAGWNVVLIHFILVNHLIYLTPRIAFQKREGFPASFTQVIFRVFFIAHHLNEV